MLGLMIFAALALAFAAWAKPAPAPAFAKTPGAILAIDAAYAVAANEMGER